MRTIFYDFDHNCNKSWLLFTRVIKPSVTYDRGSGIPGLPVTSRHVGYFPVTPCPKPQKHCLIPLKLQTTWWPIVRIAIYQRMTLCMFFGGFFYPLLVTFNEPTQDFSDTVEKKSILISEELYLTLNVIFKRSNQTMYNVTIESYIFRGKPRHCLLQLFFATASMKGFFMHGIRARKKKSMALTSFILFIVLQYGCLLWKTGPFSSFLHSALF